MEQKSTGIDESCTYKKSLNYKNLKVEEKKMFMKIQ